MGVPGLLKHLQSITRKVHIREYHGLTAAIDLHCWIHKGSIGCSRELLNGEHTSQFVDYCLGLLQLLQGHGVTPIVVFDGRPLPAKVITHTNRRKIRQENITKARDAEADGRLDDAHKFYQKTASVTPEMVVMVIEALKKHDIKYIVSPYEADAQLAYLSLNEIVDVVITEDSDALVYGCRRVLFKLDKEGRGDEIRRRSFGANQGLSFLNWTDDQFKLMCCIAGCDYTQKIRNVGIVTAHKLVEKHKTFTKTTNALLNKYNEVDEEYVKQLRRALNTFKHQTIYSTDKGRLQPLTPISNALALNYDSRFGRNLEEDAYSDYLGPMFDESLVLGLIEGALNPNTLLPFKANETKERTPMCENRNDPRGENADETKLELGTDDVENASIVWATDNQEFEDSLEGDLLSRDIDGEDIWKFNFRVKCPVPASKRQRSLQSKITVTANTTKLSSKRKAKRTRETVSHVGRPAVRKKNEVKASLEKARSCFEPLPIDMLHRRALSDGQDHYMNLYKEKTRQNLQHCDAPRETKLVNDSDEGDAVNDNFVKQKDPSPRSYQDVAVLDCLPEYGIVRHRPQFACPSASQGSDQSLYLTEGASGLFKHYPAAPPIRGECYWDSVLHD